MYLNLYRSFDKFLMKMNFLPGLSRRIFQSNWAFQLRRYWHFFTCFPPLSSQEFMDLLIWVISVILEVVSLLLTPRALLNVFMIGNMLRNLVWWFYFSRADKLVLVSSHQIDIWKMNFRIGIFFISSHARVTRIKYQSKRDNG